MEKKNIDWSNIGFGYMKTDKRYVSILKTEHGMKVHLPPMIRLLSVNVQVYFSMHRQVLKE